MNESQLRGAFIAFTKSKLGAPYVWGSNGPDTFDCSGLVVYGLRKMGIIGPDEDFSARMLMQKCNLVTADPRAGDLAFYGRNVNAVSHVAICLDGRHFYSASGGRPTTTSIDAARKAHANVKLHPRAAYRSDLLAICTNSFLTEKVTRE